MAEITREQRRTLVVAAALGWALDAFDVMLYATVLSYVMSDLGVTKSTAGLLNTLTLVASGHWRTPVPVQRRPPGAQARADAEHPEVLA